MSNLLLVVLLLEIKSFKFSVKKNSDFFILNIRLVLLRLSYVQPDEFNIK